MDRIAGPTMADQTRSLFAFEPEILHGFLKVRTGRKKIRPAPAWVENYPVFVNGAQPEI